MKTGASLKNRQGGAVAVMVGISIVLLVGFLALVIDLGHVYIAKTELQNAADAAALAGAKELNGTAPGVTLAINRAVQVANHNNYDFTKPVATTAADLDIWVCNSPGNCTVLASTAAADTTNVTAANKTFLKVDTRPRQLGTWFAPVFNLLTGGNYSATRTFGMAVAGRYIVQVTPLGVCAVDVAVGTQAGTCSVPTVNSCNGGSVKDCGFLRGVAYNIPELNPLSNGDPIGINPVDAVGSGTCSSSNGNTPILVPFLCTGQSAVINALPGCVWVNTGWSATPAERALNSRFGDYFNGVGHCDAAAAPPDTNVKEYIFNDSGTGGPRDWMEPGGNTIPSQQSIELTATGKPFNYPARSNPEIAANFSKYGVLWSFDREMNFATNVNFNLCDWFDAAYSPYCPAGSTSLYGGHADQSTTGYPTASNGYPYPSPYAQTSGVYFQAPTGVGAPYATAERRVLNIAIIDCSTATGFNGATCNQRLPVLAIGKFFMQRKADFNGSPKKLYGEFAGLVAPPLPPADIRLYR